MLSSEYTCSYDCQAQRDLAKASKYLLPLLDLIGRTKKRLTSFDQKTLSPAHQIQRKASRERCLTTTKMGARSGKRYPKLWPPTSHPSTLAAAARKQNVEINAPFKASQAGLMPFSNGTVPGRSSKKKARGRNSKHRCRTFLVKRRPDEEMKKAEIRSRAFANAQAASEAAKLVDAARTTERQTMKETKAVLWSDTETEIPAP